MSYGGILFVAGYETQNNLQVNSTIASNYNSITSASALPGGLFGNTSGLFQTVNNTASKVNQSASTNGGITNSLSLVLGFMTSIPVVLGALVNFVSIPLVALGVPIGYAQVVVSVFFLGILSLSIISAIFLFPI